MKMVKHGSAATREVGKTARGANRRLPRGKRSSLYEGKDNSKKKSISESRSSIEQRTDIEENDLSNKLPSDQGSGDTLYTGASSFFSAERLGAKGNLKKRKVNPSATEGIKVTREELLDFLKQDRKHDGKDPTKDRLKRLKHMHASLISSSIWLTMTTSNLLLYGFGSKESIVTESLLKDLEGEDVIELIGSETSTNSHEQTNDDYVARQLLRNVCEQILGIPDISAKFVHLTTAFEALAEYLSLHYGERVVDVHRGSVSEDIRPNSNLNTVLTSATLSDASDFTNELVDNEATVNSLNVKHGRRMLRDEQLSLLRWGGRYNHSHAKLYLVVHDICGPALRSRETQLCLSLLAACASVIVIAVVESLDSSVQWDQLLLSRFQWNYFHTPTFQHSSCFPRDFALIKDDPDAEVSTSMEAKSRRQYSNVQVENQSLIPTNSSTVSTFDKSLYGSALAAVLRSMTKQHHDLLRAICSIVSKKAASNAAKWNDQDAVSLRSREDDVRDVLMRELLPVATVKWIAKSQRDLDNLLKEFEDHELLKVITSNGHVVVRMNIEMARIELLSRSN